MRLGLFSGSFDPVHHGHLMAARAARNRLELHRVLFMPEVKPRHKHDVGDYKHRKAMLERALEGEPNFAVWEAAQLSHDLQTLVELEAAFPAAELFLLLGTDVAARLPAWHGADQLKGRVKVITIARPGHGTGTIFVNLPVSSATVRSSLRRGRRPSGLPTSVLRYIEEHGLYR